MSTANNAFFKFSKKKRITEDFRKFIGSKYGQRGYDGGFDFNK